MNYPMTLTSSTFPTCTAVEVRGALHYKWKEHCNTNSDARFGQSFHFLSVSASALHYRLDMYVSTDWGCTKGFFNAVGHGVSETLLIGQEAQAFNQVVLCYSPKRTWQ